MQCLLCILQQKSKCIIYEKNSLHRCKSMIERIIDGSFLGFVRGTLLLSFVLILFLPHFAYAQQKIPGVVASVGEGKPVVRDPNLKIETVTEGLTLPTTMAFVGPDDILVLEKNKGTVQRIIDGH